MVVMAAALGFFVGTSGTTLFLYFGLGFAAYDEGFKNGLKAKRNKNGKT